MKAAVLTGTRELEVVDDWAEPELPSNAVMVEVTALGVCGSDLALWSGKRQAPKLPWLIGHEAIGRVVAVGDDTSIHKVGDRVVLEPNYPCGRCPHCLAGRTSMCPNRVSIGMNAPGFLCERVAVPEQFAWIAPEGVSDADLVCTEPLAVARNAARRGELVPGMDCLVVGAGAQGLLITRLAARAGAEVAVAEPNPERLALAESIGAHAADHSGRKYSVVFETSGVAAGVRRAIESAALGGTVVLVGIPSGEVPLPVVSLVRSQMRVLGCLIYDHPRDFADTLELVAAGSLEPGRILRPPISLEELPGAFTEVTSAPGKSWVLLGERHRGPSLEQSCAAARAGAAQP